jgi:4-amino-4-deoxy-L-arabinose transferase-like glycosyltransferase
MSLSTTNSPLEAPNRKEAFVLFILFALFYFLFLGSHPLLLPDEGRYSEVAREMLAAHDFITPRLNGSLFFHKPPLFYWLQTVSISAFGINPWSLRIMPALFGVSGIVFLYWATSLLLGRNTGRIAAIILGTTPLYYGASHYANLDLEVAVCLNASILALLVGVLREKKSWLYVAYLCGGLAFLTKGLIGLAFPAAIMGLWILSTRQWSTIKKLQLPLGLILFAVICLPWLIMVSQRNPDFLRFFFYQQQFQRFAGSGFNNVAPWWFYIALVIASFLPWTYFLCRHLKALYISTANQDARKSVEAAPRVCPSRATTGEERYIVIYLTIWALVVLIFFSIPNSKLVGYIIPIFAPLAILTAIAIVQAGVQKKLFNTIVYILIALSLVAAYGMQYLPSKNMRSVRSLVNALPQNTTPLSIVSYHTYFQDLPLYSQQTVRVVYHWSRIHGDNWSSELSYAPTEDPKQKNRLIEEESFWQLWQQDTPVYVFLRRRELAAFTAQAGHLRQIASTKDTVLVTQR